MVDHDGGRDDHQLQAEAGNLRGVPVTVPLRQPRGHHVRVVDCLHLQPWENVVFSIWKGNFEYRYLERFFLYFERKVDILLKLYSDDFEQKYLKNKNNPES